MSRASKRLFLALLFAVAAATVDVRAPREHGGAPVVSVVAEAHAGLLDDPIGHVWNLFRERVLERVWAVIAKPFNDVKARVERFIEDAKRKMETVFNEHVLAPAMKAAMKIVFPGGEAGRKQVAQAVATYMGTTEAMLERVAGFEEAARAIAERSPARLQNAKRTYEIAFGRLRTFDKTKLMDILIPLAREKLESIVHGQTVNLVEIAWAILEKPVEVGITAAKGAISAIPVIGSIASAIFGAISNVALTVLRGLAVEFVSEGVSRLAMLAVDKILDWFRSKKEAEEPWLKGAFQALNETFGRIEAVISPAIKAYERFGQTLFAIEAAMKDPKLLGTKIERRYAGGMTEGEVTSALGALRDARGRVDGDAGKELAAARTKLERELQKAVVAPSFEAALTQVLGEGGKRVLSDVARRLTGDLEAMSRIDQAAGLAMQALMAADDAGLKAAEAELRAQRAALAKLDYATIKAELARRIQAPVASITVARMIERADASLAKLVDESLGVSAAESSDAATAMMAGYARDRARAQRRELEAAGRAIVSNKELGRALLEETLRAAGGAKNVSATALAAAPKLRAVVGKLKARVKSAEQRLAGLIELVVRGRKELAAAVKGGK